jgi:hypothetical protein
MSGSTAFVEAPRMVAMGANRIGTLDRSLELDDEIERRKNYR